MAPESGLNIKLPVLRITRFDTVTAMLIAAVASLAVGIGVLAMMWACSRPVRFESDAPIVTFALLPGGENGAVDETLLVETDEELSQDPSISNDQQESEIQEVISELVNVSEQATRLAQPATSSDNKDQGSGSAVGDGSKSLAGPRGPHVGPNPGERWYINIGENGSVDEYARQLDFFGIRLGALVPGTLRLLSRMSDVSPALETKTDARGLENTLYFNWKGGSRRDADVALFKRAGYDAREARILHFYPAATEQMLAKLETDFRNRKASEIRRTYFVVRPNGDGFKFVVTRQTYLK